MNYIHFNDQELIESVEIKFVIVSFLKMPEVEKYINLGQKWFINEAERIVGFGEIIELH